MPKKVEFKPKSSKRREALDSWVGGGGDSTAPTAVVEAPQSESESHTQPIPSAPAAEVPQPLAAEKAPQVKNGFPAADMKRLTIDIPKALHTRIKQTCAAKDKKMVEELRRILEEAFPPIL